MLEAVFPRIDDSLLDSLLNPLLTDDDPDSSLEGVLERAAEALQKADAERVRFYQPSSASIPGLPNEKLWYLTWFRGAHGEDVHPGFEIPFDSASIDASLKDESFSPIQGYGRECNAIWVDRLGLRDKRWVDVLILEKGQPTGLLSFDWAGARLPFSPSVETRLRLFGAVLGYQLSATEPAMSNRIQHDLDALFRGSGGSHDSAEDLATNALSIMQMDGDIASISLFRHDWTRGELVRRELKVHPDYQKTGVINPEPEPEVFRSGEFLTGMAWKSAEHRFVRDFDELKEHKPELVSDWSCAFHQAMIGKLQTVMYERVGVRDRVWLIRAINDSQEPKLPFIGKRALLQGFCRYLSPIMDAVSATKRSDAIAEIQRKISEDHATDFIMDLSQRRLQQLELVDRIMVFVIREGVASSQVPPYIWGDGGRIRSVDQFDRLLSHPSFRALMSNPRPMVARRQTAGILGQAAGLSSSEGADLLLVPARSAEYLGVLAIPVWNHADQRLKEDRLLTELSQEFVTQIARLATSAVERRQAKDLARNALRALSLVGHEMTEPLASALSISRHALATMKQESVEGRVLDAPRISSWQARFEPAADAVTAAVKLGRLVGRQHAGRFEGVRREWSAYRLLLQAGDRIDSERLLKGSLLQPAEGIVFSDTSGDLEATLVCDSGLLRAALENLLRNAVKYSISMGGPGRVDTSIRHLSDHNRHEYLEIDVTNVGFEIPPTVQGSIFAPFTRYVDDDNEVARRGMGLGLYLVSQIARGHKGTVRLTSHDFVGLNRRGTRCFQTTFTLRVRADLDLGTYREEL